MFTNFGFIEWLLNKYYNKPTKNKNRLRLHLEWLLQQGETREAKMLCPQCGKRKVKLLSIIWSSAKTCSIDADFSCCSSDACKKKLENLVLEHPHRFVEIKFSTVIQSQSPRNKKLMLRAFRRILNLPRLTKEATFEFFKGEKIVKTISKEEKERFPLFHMEEV